MLVNGLMAQVIGENIENTSYIVPAMLPDADERTILAALSDDFKIQTSKTLCFKSRNTPITRPVFHGVLAKCINTYKIPRTSLLDGLVSQVKSERKMCSKNYAFFVLISNLVCPWFFIVAYKLSYIRITLFRKRNGDCEQYCPKSIGESLLEFLKENIFDMLKYQNKVCHITEYIDTNIFGDGSTEPRDIVELLKELHNDCGSSSMKTRFSEQDVLVWFPKNRVRYIHFIYLTQWERNINYSSIYIYMY